MTYEEVSMALSRPLRSVLYIPGSKARALDKARGLPADAIIFDLEDAVSVDEKETARATLADALAAGGYGARMRIVRINGLDTEWGVDDAKAAKEWVRTRFCCPKCRPRRIWMRWPRSRAIHLFGR